MDDVTAALLMFGTLFLAQVPLLLRHRRRHAARSGRTVGQVVGHVYRFGNGGLLEARRHARTHSGIKIRTSAARIHFVVDGRPYHCFSRLATSWDVHPTGSELIVCYRPDHPLDADVLLPRTDGLLLCIGAVIGVSGALMLALGAMRTLA